MSAPADKHAAAAQASINMAEKLRQWKAAKAAAASAGAAVAAPVSATAAPKAKPAAARAAPAASAKASKPSAGSKRALSAHTDNHVAKQGASKKAKTAAVVPVPETCLVAEAAVSMEDDEDLGISFSSAEATPPPPVAPSSRLLTPVSSSLRAQLLGDSLPSASATPKATALRAQLLGESATPKVTGTPRADALRQTLRLTPPAAATPAAGDKVSGTPHTEKLRAALTRRISPRASTVNTNPAACTPVAAALSRDLRMERTPPNMEGSMEALQRSARATVASAQAIVSASRLRSAPHSAASSTENSPVASASPALVVSTPPPASLDVSASSTSPDHAPVARNLISEMADELNTSRTNVLDTSASLCAPLDDSPIRATIIDNNEDEPMAPMEDDVPVSSGAGLFDEDECIPGLSTPAPALAAPTFLSSSARAIVSEQGASGTPAKHARLLTPSKAQRGPAAEAPAAGGSSIVLASVRAHARDARKLGSDTFLSPVRRSARHQREQSMDDLDKAGLARMLEQNNYAYVPNKALGNLTPIPRTRTQEKKEMEEPVSTSRARMASTPVPPRSLSALAGSSLVVLQAVRTKRRAAASGVVDPASDEFLLSPVRRSARHTAPQSVAELTRLLATTTYKYKPNPLLAESASASVVPPPVAPFSPRTAKQQLQLEDIAEEGDSECEEEVCSSPCYDLHAHQEAEMEDVSPLSPEPVRQSRPAAPMRQATPALPVKSARRMRGAAPPPTVSEYVSMNWEPSAGSGILESKTSGDVAHQRDADGFLVPLPRPARKRKDAPTPTAADCELQAKLQAVAVALGSTAPRMATPRMDKKARMATMEQPREGTPALSSRRSTRVATPLR